MKLRTLIFLILLGIGGYYSYNFAVTQFNQPALVYKRYADALLEGDRSRAKTLAVNEAALSAFNAQAERRERLDGEERFVWYTFLNQQFSNDGKTVTMVVKQTVRVDPPGSDSFFGTEIRKDRHIVTLVQDQSAWKVQQFEDSATQMAGAKKVANR